LDHLLPPRLATLLAIESDSAFSGRLRRVHEAAARAIDRLGDLDLVRYEDAPLDDTADLSLYEEVAPALLATVNDVNALLSEIRHQFPDTEMSDVRQQADVEAVIHVTARDLTEGVAQLGALMRDPAIVSDRWNLMSELQNFRFRFREQIGNMVYETASALGDVRRADVEPGYQEALASILVLRSMTVDLRRLMRARLQRLSEAEPEDVEWNANQLEKELDSFGRTPAWKALRAQDKKQVLEFRQNLKLMQGPSLVKSELSLLLEPFVEFVDNFESINQREMLLLHDREISAACGVALERVQSELEFDPEGALRAFNEALNQGQALYGRSGDLDSFLRKLRKTPPELADLGPVTEHFRMLLANLTLY
jgi:hypothetical protein